MSTRLRALGFVLGVLAVFVAAMGVGYAVGPLDTQPAEADHAGMTASGGAGHGGHDDEVGLPGGLAVSEGGYTLRLDRSTAAAGDDVPLSFVVEGPDGAAVTAYDVEHEKRLHLVAVRRDLTGYQHVHPTMSGDGTWVTELDLRPGDWRVFADFTPTGGDATTLGADLAVAGEYEPAAPSAESTTVRVDDYTVTLQGELVAGEASPVTLEVTRLGVPVTDLQPYLGAHGHLVALRAGDLAYLHVHPQESGGTGPGVDFVAEVPSAGDYRLFLDFRHGDVVRTAELAVTAHATHPTHDAEDGDDEH